MKIFCSVACALLSLTAAASSLRAQGPNRPAAAPEPPIQTGGEIAMPQEQWVALMNSHRQPMGKLVSRKNTSRQFTRKIPGTPDGQYVVLLYSTSFEHKPAAVETVTTLLDADGRWKIVGYMVHQS